MKDINMQAGWRVRHSPFKRDFIAVLNRDNIVMHFSAPTIDTISTFTKDSNCIGRWQPKGTKNKTI